MFRRTWLTYALCIVSVLAALCACIYAHKSPVQDGVTVQLPVTTGLYDFKGTGQIVKLAKGETLELLAKGDDSVMKGFVLVRRQDGSRGWIDASLIDIPEGTPLMKTNKRASFTSRTIERKLKGKKFSTIERRYASALQLSFSGKNSTLESGNFYAEFPFCVYGREDGTLSKTATVYFEDGKASFVHPHYVKSGTVKALNAVPLSFSLIDCGVFVKAAQYSGKYSSESSRALGFLSGVLLSILGALCVCFLPMFLAAPLIRLVLEGSDGKKWGRDAAAGVSLVSAYLCFTVMSYVSGFTWILAGGMILAIAIATLFLFK